MERFAGYSREQDEQLELDEEVRDEVVRDRVRRRVRGEARRLVEAHEGEAGRELDHGALSGAVDAAPDLCRAVVRLEDLLLGEPFRVPDHVLRALEGACRRVRLPLAWPVEGGGVGLLEWGSLDALTGALIDDVLAGRAADLAERDPDAPPGAAMREAFDVAERLDEGRRPLRALAGLQNELFRLWAPLAAMRGGAWWDGTRLDDEPGSDRWRGPAVLTDPPERARIAAELLSMALAGEEVPAAGASGRLVGGRDGPAGFVLAVNDPYVGRGALEDLLRRLRSRVQRETGVPNLSRDDLRLLEVVEEVEAGHEGLGPGDRRPRGFWDEVADRYDPDAEDRDALRNRLAVAYSRKLRDARDGGG